MAAKKRGVQQRSLDTQAAITRMALKVFADQGYDGASTRKIAEAVGVNHALIAHHFGGKEALWKAAASYAFEEYETRLRAAAACSNMDKKDKLDQFRHSVRTFVLFSAEVPEFHRFMLQANRGDQERLQWLVDTFLRSDADREMSLFNLAGLDTKLDKRHLRYVLIGAVTSIFSLSGEYQLISGHDPFCEAQIEYHTDLIVTLLKPYLAS